MKALLLMLIALPLAAQTVTPDPVSARAGETVTVTIRTSVGTADAYQYKLVLPAGFMLKSQASAAQGKQIACKTGDPATCIIIDATQPQAATIAAGPLATASVEIPLTMAPGTYQMSTTQTLAVTPTGSKVTVNGGVAAITVLPNPFDLTGDGLVDKADVVAAMALYAADKPCPTVAGDSVCSFDSVIAVRTEAIRRLTIGAGL